MKKQWKKFHQFFYQTIKNMKNLRRKKITKHIKFLKNIFCIENYIKIQNL